MLHRCRFLNHLWWVTIIGKPLKKKFYSPVIGLSTLEILPNIPFLRSWMIVRKHSLIRSLLRRWPFIHKIMSNLDKNMRRRTLISLPSTWVTHKGFVFFWFFWNFFFFWFFLFCFWHTSTRKW